MIFKEVKEYSQRQRININIDDGLTPGAKVVILTNNEYDNIKNDVIELRNQVVTLQKENQILQNQEQNLKQIIKDVTAPIYENHKKELENKDLKINELNNELNKVKARINQYNLELQGLNLIDIAILRKHKKLIKDFNSTISIANPGANIVEADLSAIPGGKEKQ